MRREVGKIESMGGNAVRVYRITAPEQGSNIVLPDIGITIKQNFVEQKIEVKKEDPDEARKHSIVDFDKVDASGGQLIEGELVIKRLDPVDSGKVLRFIENSGAEQLVKNLIR